jgi:hypothetical protein
MPFVVWLLLLSVHPVSVGVLEFLVSICITSSHL